LSDLKPIIIIFGPTASGKSSLAIDLAQAFNGTVINADSMQVYKELRILTARPSSKDMALVPHRLFGDLLSESPCSVGQWLGLATDEIKNTWSDNRLAIVAGGTGMYVKALREGLAAVPKIPAIINAEVRSLYKKIGGDAFLEQLSIVDPKASKAIPANDSQRLTRALAVVRATGITLDVWQAGQAIGPSLPARFFVITILPDRKALYIACEERFDAMLDAGALIEVENLLSLGLDPLMPAMKAVGVSELSRYLTGEINLENAVVSAKKATRNLAKRQLTWLRNQVSSDYVINGFYNSNKQDDLKKKLEKFIN
jgi:tRNA dimethylallyltransferase